MSDVLTDTLARKIFDAAPPHDILVMGCRVGKFSFQLSAAGNRVWACQESIPLSLYLQRVGVTQGSEVEFFAANPLHIQPFSDDFFDAVVIEEEVGCAPNVCALLTEACRVVRPGGCIAGTHLLAEHSPRRQCRTLDSDELSRLIACFGEYAELWILTEGFAFGFQVPGGSQ